MADQDDPSVHLRGAERATFTRTLDVAARAMAKGQYRSPRDHFVYAEVELSDTELAKAWGTHGRAIARLRRYEQATKKIDWVKLREEFWRRLSKRVSDIVERDTAEEIEDVAEQYRAAANYAIAELRSPKLIDNMAKLQDNCGDDPTVWLKAVNLLARTVKTIVEIEEKLTGAKVAQQIFDSEMTNYNWFTDLVKAFVRDPNALESIAKAIQQRRTTRTLIATGEYGEAIAYARGPAKHDAKAVVKALGAVQEIAATVAPPPTPPPDDFDL